MHRIVLTVIFFIAHIVEARPSHQQYGWLSKYTVHALDRRAGANTSDQSSNKTSVMISTYSVAGERNYMEDEYYVSNDGNFAGVFDGHGGRAVSRYLRQNIYTNYQAAFPSINNFNWTESAVSSALKSAFNKVDDEVNNIIHWSFQGSTACVVVIDKNASNGTRSIIAANLGDSRAILGRNGTAVDLTQDHKPNNDIERERIEALGGVVEWCGEVDENGDPVENTGVYRINGNLALSRAIGDRCERPFVSSTVDISHNSVDEELDSFVLIATDGLYDVMTSQEIVSVIHKRLSIATLEDFVRRDMARFIGDEALEGGSLDNITVIIMWL
ncbi:LOW QUALITY PROTEIN: hypothetical protein ACHAWO_007148 [Cyclotella atomus]|uniref:PPM-type phosphatase domain-containing protein n=1 Tax=Cyclotella atomus TaxID=382360 RepID=A0ABD3PRH2_9STRA